MVPESFSSVLSPIKGEFLHSKFAQKYPICGPKARAKTGEEDFCIAFLAWEQAKTCPRATVYTEPFVILYTVLSAVTIARYEVPVTSCLLLM